jgi:hypothetical protein
MSRAIPKGYTNEYEYTKNKADIKEDIFDGEGKFKSLRM